MAKCLIDKYWNKIILSCLKFLRTFYLGGEKKLETENRCQRSREWLFLHANQNHDALILIWIIKCIFSLYYVANSGKSVDSFGLCCTWTFFFYYCVGTAFVLELF